ncbi:MAG: preprotein translocase subunit SecG [Phycisphaeraceae bacterium]
MQALPHNLQLLARGEAPSAAIWLMALGFMFICVFMMIVVLIQKPKGGGLSGAFGGGAGGGGSDNFIGGGIGNVLTAVTVVCFLIFLGLASGMTLAINANDDVPAEEVETTETVDSAGSPEGAAPVTTEDEPTPEVEPETEPEAEPESEPADETEADAEEAPADAATTVPTGE